MQFSLHTACEAGSRGARYRSSPQDSTSQSAVLDEILGRFAIESLPIHLDPRGVSDRLSSGAMPQRIQNHHECRSLQGRDPARSRCILGLRVFWLTNQFSSRPTKVGWSGVRGCGVGRSDFSTNQLGLLFVACCWLHVLTHQLGAIFLVLPLTKLLIARPTNLGWSGHEVVLVGGSDILTHHLATTNQLGGMLRRT